MYPIDVDHPEYTMSDHEQTGSFRRRVDLPHRVAARLGLRGDQEASIEGFLESVRKADEAPSRSLPGPPPPAGHTEAKRRLLRDLPPPLPRSAAVERIPPLHLVPDLPSAVNPSPVAPVPPAPVLVPNPDEDVMRRTQSISSQRQLAALIAEDQDPELLSRILRTPRPSTLALPPTPTPAPEPIVPVPQPHYHPPPVQPPALTTAAPSVRRTERRREHRSQRDWALMMLVTVLELVECYTVWHGVSQFLNPFASLFVTLGILGILWLFLTRVAGKFMPGLVRSVLTLSLSAAVVYCSVFTYYEGLTGDQRTALASAQANEAHAAVVGALYASHAAEASALTEQAKAKWAQAETEAASGGRTGRVGYGPVAQGLKAEGDELSTRAAAIAPRVEALRPYAEPTDTTPDGLFQADVKLWQSAGDWRGDMPMPERTSYVDEASEVELLLPVRAVRSGDTNGWAALIVSCLVTGTALVSGMFIEYHKRAPFLERLTRSITQILIHWKTAAASVQTAQDHDGEATWVGQEDGEL